MTVLLWGLRNDPPLHAVGRALAALGAPTLLVDQHEVLAMQVRLEVGASVGGCISIDGRQHDLAAIGAVYTRTNDARQVAAVARAGPGSAAWQHAQLVDNLLGTWLDVTPALVVNPFAAMATNGSKPYQLEFIRRAGFAVPATLITTDPAAALAFWEQHGEVIYKSVSAVRSVVARLRATDRERLADVCACPTQFQQYIAGRDHRVHVVGKTIFAAEVVTEAEDYRYPRGRPVEIRACRLPPDVEARCLNLATALGLPVAGIDLRRTPDGDWYGFEVNPSPAFTYYESRTEQPIGAAVADLLAGAVARS